jgi:hypothetical protein
MEAVDSIVKPWEGNPSLRNLDTGKADFYGFLIRCGSDPIPTLGHRSRFPSAGLAGHTTIRPVHSTMASVAPDDEAFPTTACRLLVSTVLTSP